MKAHAHSLSRFVAAQDEVYSEVVAELTAGRKTSHWIWFIFPQIAGLGYSPTSVFYAITSPDEARAYLNHPVLGTRLDACVRLVLRTRGQSIETILGAVDAVKFRSSMTLFAAVAKERGIFGEALDTFFGGQPDPRTLERLPH